MIRSTWQDSFMVGIIFIAVIFALCAGWIIINHYDEEPTGDITTLSQTSHQTSLPHKSPPAVIPNTFSAEFVQHMTNRIEKNQNSTKTPEVSNKNFSNEFESGFQWASTNHVKNFSQCPTSSVKDYTEGCRTFIEIDNYISRIQINPNFKPAD